MGLQVPMPLIPVEGLVVCVRWYLGLLKLQLRGAGVATPEEQAYTSVNFKPSALHPKRPSRRHTYNKEPGGV